MAGEQITTDRAAIRDRAIELRKTGRSIIDVANEVGQPVGTVSSWMTWARKHGKIGAITPAPVVEAVPAPVVVAVPVAIPAPIVHSNGPSDFLGELNLERRAELEWEAEVESNQCPLPGLVAAIQEEEERVLVRTEALPEAKEYAGLRVIPPDSELASTPTKAEYDLWPPSQWPPGAWLIVSFVAIVLIVVLIVTQM